MSPSVFISYSWSSPGHQARIRQWAERLVGDGVEVTLDTWDLNEGDDKYIFMEQMVTKESVTHVLVFSDSQYAAKADARKAGVGTESQIISREIYSKVQQSKFIPIVCEFDDEGEPFLPIFLKSRIWIDFSSPEAANDNWEQLIRALFGKPAHQKPILGKPPTYAVTDTSAPVSPVAPRFAALRQAVLQEKRGLKLYRQDFLDACYEYADVLRIRARPDVSIMGERVLEDCRKLKIVRDHIIDWALLEAESNPSEEFGEALVALLERLLELKSGPPEINAWSDVWFEVHGLFVYETFLYIVASLMKTGAFKSLHLMLTTHYLLPAAGGMDRFEKFEAFYSSSDTLQILAPAGQRLYAPAAELIKRQADREDLPFSAIVEADLLVLMMASLGDGSRWYPQTLHYASRHGAFPFFLRAAQKRHFVKLATITGISDAARLRDVVKAGYERLGMARWSSFWSASSSFWQWMNMEMLDTIN